MFKKWFVLFITVLSTQGATAAARPMPTVEKVDLDRYLGIWYEVASIPQSFQSECIKDSRANYSLEEDGRIKVLNSCTMANGDVKESEARAKIIDTATNSKLKVTFVKIFGWVFAFGGKYWIVDLAEDYSYSVIGNPNREYLWILSRTPTIEPSVMEKIKVKLEELEYDLCKVRITIQTDGLSKADSLCDK